MNLDEFKTSVTDDIEVELPFAPAEFTDKIFNRAVEKSFSRMNMYRPKVIRVMEEMNLPGYKLIRAYTSEFDDNSHIPYVEEYGMAIGRKYLYSVEWTIESISEDRVAFKYFKDLVIAFSGMFMANVRRSANISGMPFELNGDAFYTEYSQKVDSVTEDIINTCPNTL